LGAIGIATKLVSLAIVSGNIQAWVVSRYSGWKFDWAYQVVGVPLMLGLGYIAKLLVGLLWNLEVLDVGKLIIPVILAAIIYCISVVWMLWLFPWLIGIDRAEIMNSFEKLRRFSFI